MATLSSVPPHLEIKHELTLSASQNHSLPVLGLESGMAQFSGIIKDENKENVNNIDLQDHADTSAETAHEDDSPVIDIHISNVVCTFNLRCHINLKRLAMEGSNVEYRREHGILNMKLRRPTVTANITSSGKCTITGSTSEAEAKVAARRVARRLQKWGFNVRFFSFKVVNVLGTCSLPFGIKLNSFSNQYPQEASYEPELHPGVTYRIKDPKATLKIFSTGSITITAPCVSNIGTAVEHIYPLVSEFQMEKRVPKDKPKKVRQSLHQYHTNSFSEEEDDEYDDDYCYGDSEFEESFDSDVSHD